MLAVKRRLVNRVVSPTRVVGSCKGAFCLLLSSEIILRVGFVLEGVEKESSSA